MHSDWNSLNGLPFIRYESYLLGSELDNIQLSPAFRTAFVDREEDILKVSDLHKKMHPNDAVLLKNKLFGLLNKHLASIEMEDIHHWTFSLNYRLLVGNGTYMPFLDQFCISEMDIDGNPLKLNGLITMIAGIRSDYKVLFTATRIGEEGCKIYSEQLLPAMKNFFSRREKEILNYIINGLSSKQIAHILNLSINTVHNHRKNMLAKTNAHNTAELIRYIGEMEFI